MADKRMGFDLDYMDTHKLGLDDTIGVNAGTKIFGGTLYATE